MLRVISPVAALLLVCLLWAEKTGANELVLLFKAPLSLLFVLTAFVQDHRRKTYYRLVFAGLVFGLVGDVCLAIPGNVAFSAGLAAFLCGHIFYTFAFASITKMADWIHPVGLIILASSGLVFLWLRPHLGSMLLPVAVYMVIISAMVLGAWSVFSSQMMNRVGARVILLGAALFYFSDVFVARDRFIVNDFMNRLIGLPLYYCGQFLLAFSVGLFKSKDVATTVPDGPET
ncbi:MAG: lysoplasmalogenase [Desulfomonilaceae bacterium]